MKLTPEQKEAAAQLIQQHDLIKVVEAAAKNLCYGEYRGMSHLDEDAMSEGMLTLLEVIDSYLDGEPINDLKSYTFIAVQKALRRWLAKQHKEESRFVAAGDMYQYENAADPASEKTRLPSLDDVLDSCQDETDRQIVQRLAADPDAFKKDIAKELKILPSDVSRRLARVKDRIEEENPEFRLNASQVIQFQSNFTLDTQLETTDMTDMQAKFDRFIADRGHEFPTAKMKFNQLRGAFLSTLTAKEQRKLTREDVLAMVEARWPVGDDSSNTKMIGGLSLIPPEQFVVDNGRLTLKSA